MPITRSAKKKLREDKKRGEANLRVKVAVKSIIKKFRAKPSTDLLSSVYRLLDTAKKKNIYHANKVSRLKSHLSKLLSKKSTPAEKVTKKKVKTEIKKTAHKPVKKNP
jgi:small subunit ribosomal protein S20